LSPDDDDVQSHELIVDTNDDDDREGVLLVDDRSNEELFNYTSKGTNLNGNTSATTLKSETNHISKVGTSLKRKSNSGTKTAKNCKKPRMMSSCFQEEEEEGESSFSFLTYF
jgi:hypothetical protein